MSFGLNFFSIPQPVILRERSDRRIFLTPRKYEILRGAQDDKLAFCRVFIALSLCCSLHCPKRRCGIFNRLSSGVTVTTH
jgi:hypothetical protein